jgi:hypothetical protein
MFDELSSRKAPLHDFLLLEREIVLPGRDERELPSSAA